MTKRYYYGKNADGYTFIRIPKLLVTDELFSSVTIQAKILYGLLLDRMGLSVKYKWIDEKNRVYVIYPLREIQEDLGISRKKAKEYLKELECAGLLERQHRGFGLPCLLYIKNFKAA